MERSLLFFFYSHSQLTCLWSLLIATIYVCKEKREEHIIMIEMSKMYIERSYFGLRVHPFSFSCPGSDEEDDVIRHHDLVVILHASQSIADLCLGEVLLAALVDVVH